MKKAITVNRSLDGNKKSRMIKGQTARLMPAITPQSQVSFILQKQAKRVRPTVIAAVRIAAMTTSGPSNHCVKPATI